MTTAKRLPKRTGKQKRAKSLGVSPEAKAEFQHGLDAYMAEWEADLKKHILEQDRPVKRAKPKSR